jgi:2-polyprenyl-6-methoxyphenol hydroxylase-like FAD-dependent oxidoreductase
VSLPNQAQVVIAGGGPCGLMLANELGRRGISVVLVDEKASTAFNPQANATQARTMEHYRRLGFSNEIRSQGLPGEYPTDIAYFTRFANHELARFQLPSARQAGDVVKTLAGSWSAAELPHRVSQKFVETILRRHAEALPGVKSAEAPLEKPQGLRVFAVLVRRVHGVSQASGQAEAGAVLRRGGSGRHCREMRRM